MHVESVAWVTERKDVLYSFFFIPGLITYIYYLKKQKLLYLLMTYLLFLLSLFTKSAAVCFPLVIVLLDYYYKTKYNIKEIISRIPLFILSAIFGYVAVHSQESSGAIADLTPSYNIFERVFLACYSLSFYIIKLFIPAGLCAMHYFPEKSGNVLPSEYYLSALLISGIVIALILVKSPKYKMHLIFGLLFFLATIIMVIQIIPIGFAITAERYTYLPYIGLTIPIGIVLHDIIEDKTNKLYKSRNIFIITLIAFTAGFSATTYSRNKVWRDGIALFTDVIEKNPKKFHGYWIRGSAYSNKKDYKMAIADFDKTLQCKPPNAAEVLNNRGNAKNNIDDYEGAFKDLNEAIRINPKLAEAYSNRGSARDNLGDYKGAMEDYDKALSLKPEMITAYNNRGVTKGKIALSKGGDIQKNMQPAIDDFNTAIKINPYDPSSYLNRGNAKGFLRDFQGSLHDFNIAVKLGPKEHQAYFNRGITKLNLKDTAGACADWQKASELGSKSAKELVNNLCNRF
jgi:tetratricopeptide (TPR) repeat protein